MARWLNIMCANLFFSGHEREVFFLFLFLPESSILQGKEEATRKPFTHLDQQKKARENREKVAF